jgi:hypothetical protein
MRAMHRHLLGCAAGMARHDMGGGAGLAEYTLNFLAINIVFTNISFRNKSKYSNG